MTFSAPKSVSVMATVGGDERLATAHETAVREALQEAEKSSATRVRLAGLNENRTTGNWIVAAYTHDTSRELDPQFHTHAVAANLTFDGVEGRWKALQASGLYERRTHGASKRQADQDAHRAFHRADCSTASHLEGSTMVFLAVFTRLRVGELLGLKWKDLDLKKMEINVIRSIVMQHVGDCKDRSLP